MCTMLTKEAAGMNAIMNKINDERDTLSHKSFLRIEWKIGIHTVGAVAAVAVANVVRVRVTFTQRKGQDIPLHVLMQFTHLRHRCAKESQRNKRNDRGCQRY